jgi:hypothetical protein
MKNLDHAQKIMYLTYIIRSICKENKIPKEVVIEDFIYLMNEEESNDEIQIH